MDTAITTAETVATATSVVDFLALLDAPVAKAAEVVQPVKAFKSDRAARVAFGKAERAWEAARGERIHIEHAQRNAETKVAPTPAERNLLEAYRATYQGLSGNELQNSPAFNAYCDLWNEINGRPVKEARAIEDAAFAAMVAIYEQAQKQGIWIKSYELNYNAIRDLIANNCD